MATTTKTLRLTFKNSEAKKVNLSLPNAKPDLSADEVKTAMTTISGQGVFAKDGVELYHEPHAAAYIERTVTSLFANDPESGDAQAD
jgi:hypothetical protein